MIDNNYLCCMGKEALLHIPIIAHIISCTKCVVVLSRQQLHTGDGAYWRWCILEMVHTGDGAYWRWCILEMVHTGDGAYTVDRMQLIFAERTHLS